MPGNDTEVDAVLTMEGGVQTTGNNKTECFSYKGEWANAYVVMYLKDS